MKPSQCNYLRLTTACGLLLLFVSDAQAQRIPDFVIWSAGASLFAPFVAVPIKAGILRLLKFEARSSRLWAISAIEWVLWFPTTIIVLRYGRSSPALVLLVLLAALVWLHSARLTNARLGYALLLSLLTPILAFLLWGLTILAVDRFYY